MGSTARITVCLALAVCGNAQASLVTRLLSTDTTPNSDVMDGDLFLDAASLGGGDIFAANYTLNTVRTLDLDGSVGAPNTSGTITIKGFAFASANNITNPATSLTFSFKYLGLNGVDDGASGGDDVFIGATEAVGFNDGIGNELGFEGTGRYYVNFDNPVSAMIDGANENFLVTIAPSGGNIRFKTTSGTNLNDAKFSISGSFVSVPESSSFLALGLAAIVGYSTKWNRK